MSWYDPSTWRWSDFDPTRNKYAAAALGPLGAYLYGAGQLLGGGPGVPGFPGLPTAPDLTDQTVILAQLEKKRRLASLQGRGSTFLTGPRGIGGPSGEIAQAMLRASLEGPEDLPTMPPWAGLPPATPAPPRRPPPEEPPPGEGPGYAM